MRKNFLTLLTMFLAIFAITSQTAAAQVSEPTLTQMWKHTENLPSPGWGSYVKDATGKDGKVYIQTQASSSIAVWDENGVWDVTIGSGGGVGICLDGVGNIIAACDASGSTVPANFVVIPEGSTTSQELKLTLTAPGRSDYLGGASGDILSVEGGKLYIYGSGQSAINVVTIKEGVQTDCVSVATSVAGDETSIAYPVAGDDNAFLVHKRGNQAIYLNDGAGNETELTTPNINTTAASSMFQLDGVNYVVYNIGVNYGDGFSIANMETGEVVATHEAETAGGTTNGSYSNQSTCEVVSDTKVNIYVYTAAMMIAKYEFEVPAVEYDPIYLIGEVNSLGWVPNVGATLESTDGITYTGTVSFDGTSEEYYSYFGIATKLGETDLDWDTLNANRYGAAADGEILANDAETAIVEGSAAFKILTTEYVVTVNMTDKTIKAVATGELPVIPEVVYPDAVYLIGGGIEGAGEWDPEDGLYVAKVEDTEATYFIEGVVFTAETTEWKISEILASWDDNAAYLYGATADAMTVSGEEYAIAKGAGYNFKTAAGTYNIFIDLVEGVLVCDEVIVPVADRAIYAYGLKSYSEDDMNFITFSLNTDAERVEVIFKDAEGNVVGTIDGETEKGEQTIGIGKDAFIGQDLTWEVKATGAAIDAYNRITDAASDYAFYAPYGVSVDNNPESANFGNVYVTNSGNDAAGDYSLAGLAAFTPDLVRYSVDGTNLFTGGITARNGSTAYDYRKVEVLADGSIVIGSDVKCYSQLYKTTFSEMANDWTAMFVGTQDADTGNITNEDGETISSPVAAIAVEGKGADQKIWTLNGYYLSFTGVSCYNVGENETISTVADKTYAAPEGQIISSSSSMLADGLGGYWVTQYRASGNSTQPSVAHYNAEGVRDYVRYTADTDLEANFCQAGGIAINEAGDVIALAYSTGTVRTYELVYDEAGAPTLTFITEFAAGIGSNINEIAFDYAGNIHLVSNSGEWYAAYSGITADNTSTVPAAAAYALDFAEPIPADRAIFAYGLYAMESDDNYELFYSLNTDATSVEIIIKDAEGNQVGEVISGGIAKGDNYAIVAKSDYAGENLSWEVKATGSAITEYAKITEATSDYAFYAPYGVAVDNNPESAQFGYVYVTNSGNDTAGDYSLVGLAAYDPSLTRYEANGSNLFNGGVTARTGGTASDFRKVRVLEDGSILVGSATQSYSPIYKTDLYSLDEEWESLFNGIQEEGSDTIYNAAGEIIGSSVLAMDVIGSGADQQLWVTNGFGYSFTTVRRYDIGYKSAISEVADLEWDANENMINYTSASMRADGLGGYWATQYRASGNTTEPNLVHYNAQGVLDYETYSADTTVPNMVRQGGIAIKDNLMALGGTGSVIDLYTVEYDAAGAPTLTYIESFSPGIGYNMNEIEFDYAGNIHVVSNSGEWYAAYSGKTDNNTTTVKCGVNYILNSTFETVAPEITEISTDDEGFITVNWKVEDATPIYYMLALEIEGELYKAIDGVTETSIDIYLTDLTEDTTIDVTVAAVYANGDIEVSATVPFIYEVSGVASTFADVVSVYPNPTVDVVTVTSAEAMNIVEVYSAAGALVAKVDAAGAKSVMIDVAAEAAGIYFIKVDSANTIKLIKK